MACDRHLDRVGQCPGLMEESWNSPTKREEKTTRTSSRMKVVGRKNNPRRLLLSADRLIYVLFAPTTIVLLLLSLFSSMILSVEGKFLEDCEKVSVLPGSSSSDVALSCKLRTINSEFDKTNFSALSGDSIVSLKLECSNVLFYQSSLQPGSLAHLSRLQNLHIEHCKLSRLSPGVFSGLSLLKNLTIRTHNTAWPALSLDIASGVFSEAPLDKIDLSANNIWTFPVGVFCASKSLEHLNVSLNRLQDISDLGFREREDKSSSAPCGLGLQVLDISYNRLILLPARGLARASNLQELYLQFNEISMVAENSLQGLTQLRVLNLTNNRITSLPEKLFQETKEINEIYLRNNSLVSLPPRLLSGLEHLVVLDLSHNSIATLEVSSDNDDNKSSTPNNTTTGFFQNLVRLVIVDISFNKLEKLDSRHFRDLNALQVLDAQYNSIEVLLGTFSANKNMHTIILSHNKLKSIATTFNGPVLSVLSLDNNAILEIHQEAFRNCSSLRDLNLNGNDLSSVPTALQNLSNLRTLDLGENSIRELPQLKGLTSLYGLRLTGNKLSNLSSDVLKDLPSLRVLNLARNRIQTVEKGAFDANKNLQAIRLDANYLQDISNLFSEAPSLIFLNVSDNNISYFDFSMIPKQLQWLDLHKNEITDLGNYFEINDLHLQTLDVSFNRLTRISQSSIPDSIELAFFHANLIVHIEPNTFYNKVNLSRVDIFENQIETLEIRALQLSPFPVDKPLPEFYIAGNPFVCDCSMEWLTRATELSISRQHPQIVDIGSIECRPTFANSNHMLVPIVEARADDFLCRYESHCFTTCGCCEFDACDCSMKCTDNCTCFHSDTWDVNIVSCRDVGYSQIPARIPLDSTEVYFDGNSIHTLKRHTFIGLKNLKTLYLNGSQVEIIQNRTFNSLKSLEILRLDHNFLTQLNGWEFADLHNLRELYLHNNLLHYIAKDTFAGLSSLLVLRLDSNKLVDYSFFELSANGYLISVTLSNNPWSCDCDYVSQAAPWIQSNVHKLMDPSGVNCRLNGKSLSLVYMNFTKCSEITALSGASETPDTKLPPYLPLLAAVMAICLLIGSVFLAVCRKRNSLRIWAVAKCPLNQCYRSSLDDDREKLYDAYVAYSVKDEAWVSQVFAAELQQQFDHPYRLCLHYKDFPVTAYIADTIVEAVESSKRTVLVLSKNFLQSEWCRFEFKSALHAALRGKRQRLVAVTLGDLPTRDLDPDLRVCLRSATVLSANDKLFWAKLRCALPEPRASYTARTLMTMSRPGSGGSGSVQSAASIHNYTTSSLGGASTLPLNISDSSNGNHLHHLNLNNQHHHPPPPHHHTMTMNHHHHHHPPHHQQFFNSTLGTNGFLPNVNSSSSSASHLNGSVVTNGNNHAANMNGCVPSDSNANNGTVPVPLYVPPFPPPNRPPPPFPAPRRPPPPAPLWA